MNETLQTILIQAEQQHARHRNQGDFTHQLLLQAAGELSLNPLSLWIQHGQATERVAWTGDTQPAFPATSGLENLNHGEVRVIPQTDSGFESPTMLLAASALAADALILLLAGQQGPPVDRDDLSQLVDVFADLQRRRLLESFLDPAAGESAWQSLLLMLHVSLDERVIANTIATDAAELLSARRIGVGKKYGRRWDIVATTGVSQPNDRSDASRELRNQIESAVTGVSTAANPEHCCVRPLTGSGEWSDAEWGVVVEFKNTVSNEKRLNQLLKHASVAMFNCKAARRRSPVNLLRSGMRAVAQMRTLVIIAVAGATTAALLLLQADLRIEAYGQLMPKQRLFVFAPDDGIVTELYVEDQSELQVQDPLCVLTNEDLNVQQETIEGELAAVNARLASIDALRGGRHLQMQEAWLLSAERAELQQRQQSLTRQSLIMTKRLNHLHVQAGMNGRVYGDRLRQTLFQRPVQRGQYLFEVADPDAGWQLHLRVPEADVRYVAAAAQNAPGPLEISFSLETSPEVTRQTTLSSLRAATDVDRHGQLSTQATAELTDMLIGNERPGAGVVARIHCGRRSLGFIWFRKVFEFVQRQTWL